MLRKVPQISMYSNNEMDDESRKLLNVQTRNYLWDLTPRADILACISCADNKQLNLKHIDFCTLIPGRRFSQEVLLFYGNVIKPKGAVCLLLRGSILDPRIKDDFPSILKSSKMAFVLSGSSTKLLLINKKEKKWVCQDGCAKRAKLDRLVQNILTEL